MRLICLGAFPQDSSGYLHSTEVYFVVSGGVLILCIVAQLHAMKNPLVIKCLENTQAKEVRTKVHIEENIQLSKKIQSNNKDVQNEGNINSDSQLELDPSPVRVNNNHDSSFPH